jgi:hypothetical protein
VTIGKEVAENGDSCDFGLFGNDDSVVHDNLCSSINGSYLWDSFVEEEKKERGCRYLDD